VAVGLAVISVFAVFAVSAGSSDGGGFSGSGEGGALPAGGFLLELTLLEDVVR